MTAWLALISPILALAGIYVGARLTGKREREKAAKERILAAYAKLLDASAEASGPRAGRIMKLRQEGGEITPEDEKFANEIGAKFSNAHSNIMIYGSKEVIAALSNFYDHASVEITPEGRDALVALIGAMRRESDAEDYDAFEAHADNILVTGPARRSAASAPHKSPPASFGISYSRNEPKAEVPGKE